MWKIHNLFFMSLLGQNMSEKEQINKLDNDLPEPEKEFETRTTSCIKSKEPSIVRYMARKQIAKCLVSTTSFRRKAIWKKKTLKSRDQQLYTSNN